MHTGGSMDQDKAVRCQEQFILDMYMDYIFGPNDSQLRREKLF